MKKIALILIVLALVCGAAFATDGYEKFRDETFPLTVGNPHNTGYAKFANETFKGFNYITRQPKEYEGLDYKWTLMEQKEELFDNCTSVPAGSGIPMPTPYAANELHKTVRYRVVGGSDHGLLVLKTTSYYRSVSAGNHVAGGYENFRDNTFAETATQYKKDVKMGLMELL